MIALNKKFDQLRQQTADENEAKDREIERLKQMDDENEAKDREIERLAAELQGKPDDLNLSANEVTQLANMLERKKASKIALKQELEDKEAELKQERDAGMAKD